MLFLHIGQVPDEDLCFTTECDYIYKAKRKFYKYAVVFRLGKHKHIWSLTYRLL